MSGLSGVKDIACGGNHTLALLNAGTVYCWGSITAGQCGNGSPSYSPAAYPIQAYAVSGVVAIAAGSDSLVAVTSQGTVFGWGSTGYSSSSSSSQPYYPALIPGFTNIKSVAAGSGYTLAVKVTDGSVLV